MLMLFFINMKIYCAYFFIAWILHIVNIMILSSPYVCINWKSTYWSHTMWMLYFRHFGYLSKQNNESCFHGVQGKQILSSQYNFFKYIGRWHMSWGNKKTFTGRGEWRALGRVCQLSHWLIRIVRLGFIGKLSFKSRLKEEQDLGMWKPEEECSSRGNSQGKDPKIEHAWWSQGKASSLWGSGRAREAKNRNWGKRWARSERSL